MEDNRNFIDQSQDRAKLISGRELEPDELAIEFAKCSPTERVDYLDRIGVEIANTDFSIGDAAKLIANSRAMQSVHEKLRKVGR